MAFVPVISSLSSSSFLSALPLSKSSRSICARTPRMQTSTESSESTSATEKAESPVFGKAGQSMWKESLFTGGFPGGEEFYKAWTEDGMTKDVPDVPENMQSKSEFKPKTEKKGGVLSVLDGMEYFKGFEKPKEIETGDEDGEEGEGDDKVDAVTGTLNEDSDAPDPKLYEMYYPQYVLNKAPEISFVYEGKPETDTVSMAMTTVEGDVTDLYFPRERKNKAPIIQLFYKGSLKNAYVSVKMDEPEPMVIPNVKPTNKGEVETKLVKGNSGGLKLEFSVDGQQI